MHGITDENNYKAIADAIREKNGSDAQYLPSEMADAIGALPNPAQFGAIGWDADDASAYDALLAENIAYSKTLYDKWDPSKTSANTLYGNNKQIRYAPNIDTSKVTDMKYMFVNCVPLQIIPLLDTSKVTNMDYMFHGCTFLQTIPALNTANVTNMICMFFNCTAIHTIPLLDTSKVTNMADMFYGCTSLQNLGGFKNLRVALNLSACTLLTHESLMNVINNLYDLASNGLGAKTLTLGATNLAKLTEEEKAIASDKGWTLA